MLLSANITIPPYFITFLVYYYSFLRHFPRSLADSTACLSHSRNTIGFTCIDKRVYIPHTNLAISPTSPLSPPSILPYFSIFFAA